MPNSGPLDESPSLLAKAESLYAPLEEVVKEFVCRRNLEFPDYYKWYHGSSTVLFGKDIGTLGFKGIRRQINLVFNLEKDKLLITIAAFQDKYREPVKDIPEVTERKLKNIDIIRLDLPVFSEKLLHYLDIAWRVVCSIEEGELLSEDDWKMSIAEQAKILELR